MTGVTVHARRLGETQRAMLAAPYGNFYVWPSEQLDYPKRLAKELGRSDLVVVGPSWLRENQACRPKPYTLPEG